MKKRWRFKPAAPKEHVSKLQNELQIPDTLANLLVQRNITSFDDARTFFNPSWDQLHDPYGIKDMDLAVDRIGKAFANDEKILIYGDYDVDGTTAVSLLHSFLIQYHDLLDFYIPDRYLEGYGVSIKGIDYAKDTGCSLIIALDCGIKAIEQVTYAKEKGIDFIVCDHHRPGATLPDAVAILDPKRTDCNYPFKELCGCGIGFKLAHAFAMKNDLPAEDLLPFLDLVAVATASDIVPMVGENRVLSYFGLKQLNTEPRTGFRPFIEAAKKSQFDITDLVFIIAPRINAAGRIHSGKKAVELLISDNLTEAEKIAQEIDAFNEERRELDQVTTSEALSMLDHSTELQRQKTTVVYQPHWHKGVVGIVASRLMEHYYRPTIVLTKSNGKIAGSARSVEGFDIYNALQGCQNELIQFGGHKYAAGMTLEEEQIQPFTLRFEQVVKESIEQEQLIPAVNIDAAIDFDLLIPDVKGNPLPKMYRLVQRFAPFGPQNMRPIFVTHGVIDNGYSKVIGADESHLKLNMKQPQFPDTILSGIAFGMGHLIERIKKEPFSVAYTIEINEWQNTISLQLNVKDIKFESELDD